MKIDFLTKALLLLTVLVMLLLNFWKPASISAAGVTIYTKVVPAGSPTTIAGQAVVGFSCPTPTVCVIASR